MKAFLVSLCTLLLTGAAPRAVAQDEGQGPEDLETVTAGRHTPLVLPEDWENPLRQEGLSPKEAHELPFGIEAYRGSEQLGLNPGYIDGVRAGLHLMYLRDYKGVREHFAALDERFPNTGISAVADTLVWQVLMLENFDYKYDSQYWVTTRRAREELEAALEIPGSEGWEHFLMAGVVGIESIHTMRQERYLPALQLALDAMAEAGKAKEAAPGFTDLLLADGMYNYWRTVVTQNSRMLPDFGDLRMEGLEQMRTVESEGVFLGPPASLALAFSYIEEHKLKAALSACARNARPYPDNIINNLLLGQVQTYMRRYTPAMASFDRILAVAPNNKRVRYWRGVTLLRSGRSPEAEQELLTYLAFDYLEDHQRAGGHYRLGQAYYRQKRYPEAVTEFKKAVKQSGHKGAKASLDRMKRLRREGRIDF
ncbi:MAG: tetratricopeptide repeat protein [Deltaproteobacteria bacterium]|nr:tetratricopeptide repeat protein [Deltaproteobacteria bacterium]MBW2254914.1 tetratricopeptide repeat protein [Deltaproteobacteria bacterium]